MPMVTSIYLLSLMPFREGLNCSPPSRFGSPEVIHIDQGPAFHNELVQELLRLCAIENSFATAYSCEENGIVERANATSSCTAL